MTISDAETLNLMVVQEQILKVGFKGVSFYSFDDIELIYSCDDIELNASLEDSDVCCSGSILVAANSTCLFIGMPEPWHKSLAGGLYKNTL